MEGIDNFEKLMRYTGDRIYCAGECGGNFDREMNNILIKIKEYISKNESYDPLKDIDSDGNNPLHLVAKNGFYELFNIFLMSQESFDKMKNMPNNRNETPLDLVKIRLHMSMPIINPHLLNDISICVTTPYYVLSFPKLEKLMIEHGCVSNFRLMDMFISRINESIEKYTDDQVIKKHALEIIRLERGEVFNICMGIPVRSYTEEENNTILQEKIDEIKKDIQPDIEYLWYLHSRMSELPSEKIDSFEDLLGIDEESSSN